MNKGNTYTGGVPIIGSVDTDHTLLTDPPTHSLRDQEDPCDFDPEPRKARCETCPSFAILHGVYGSDINAKSQRIEVVTDSCYAYTSFPQRLPLEEIVRREVFSLCGAPYRPSSSSSSFSSSSSLSDPYCLPRSPHPTPRYPMTPARREGMTAWASRETDEVNGLLRGLKWRSYIGSLSTDCRSWAAEVTMQRTEYSRWRSKYLFDPKNRRTGSPAPSPSLAPAQSVHLHGVPELPLAPSSDPEAAVADDNDNDDDDDDDDGPCGDAEGGDLLAAQARASEELAYVEHAEQQKEINEDVVRTYSDHEFFARQDIRDIMNRVLMVYSRRHTDLSYVQGMNEILAPIVYALASDYNQVRALTAEESSVDLAALTGAEIADLSSEDVRAIISEVVRVDYIEHDAYWLFTCLMRVIGPWFNSPKHPVPLSFISSPTQQSQQSQLSQQLQQTQQSQLSQLSQQSQQLQQSQLSQQLHSPTLLSASPIKPATSVSPLSSPVKSQRSLPVLVPMSSGADSSTPSSVGSITLLARFSGGGRGGGPFGTPRERSSSSSSTSSTRVGGGNLSARNNEFDAADECENEIEVVAKCREIQGLLAEKDPELERTLRELGIQPQLYMLRWVRILFSQVFPLDDLLPIWDAIFACGAPFRLVDHFCVAMLTLIRKSIIGCPYSSAMNALFHYPLALFPTSMIVSIALSSMRSGTRPYYREAYLPPPAAPIKFPDLVLDADAASPRSQQQQQLTRGATLFGQSSNSVVKRIVIRKGHKANLGGEDGSHLRERSSGPIIANGETHQKEKEKEKEKDSFQSKKESLQNFFGGLLKKTPRQESRKHPTQEQMDELTKLIVSLRYEKLHYTNVFDQVEGKLDKLALLMATLKEMVADEAALDVVRQAESEVEDIKRVVSTQAPQHLAPFPPEEPTSPQTSPAPLHQQQHQNASMTSLQSLSPPGFQDSSPPLL